MEHYCNSFKEVSEEKKRQIEVEFEAEFVEELLQKFRDIGIKTDHWEYEFGDGNCASEFIQAGIKDHLEKLSEANQQNVNYLEEKIATLNSIAKAPEPTKEGELGGKKCFDLLLKHLGTEEYTNIPVSTMIKIKNAMLEAAQPELVGPGKLPEMDTFEG